MSSWSDRAQAYRESPTHREGPDLDLLVQWCEPEEGVKALDVATGGGHVARRLREEGAEVITLDPSPGMQADVLASAEHIPFADGSFDVVACRVAAHHFADVTKAVGEMARVSRGLVLMADNLFLGERVEEAEKLRDPTHVRCYSESEWRGLFAGAGLTVEDMRSFEKRIELEPWLARAGCEGDEARRVQELLGHRIEGDHVVLSRVALKGRKR
jgi:SAM-dependent methyltransferase